jgi:3-oxoacyl-[acyl-carrier protein] reductase
MNTNGVVLSLAGEVALITGGSRGIGAATVRMFVKAGA